VLQLPLLLECEFFFLCFLNEAYSSKKKKGLRPYVLSNEIYSLIKKKKKKKKKKKENGGFSFLVVLDFIALKLFPVI
jgi:hypothetical protein